MLIFYIFGMIDHPDDSISYRDFGNSVVNSGNIKKKILDVSVDYGDWGYFYLMGVFYNTLGSAGAELGLALFKIFAHLVSCLLLFKLSINYLGRKEAAIVCAFWGLNVYTLYFVTSGLKEPIFEVLSITATYLLVKCLKKLTLNRVLFFVLVVTLTAFFRTIYPFYYILTFLGFKFFKDFINKNIIYFLICWLFFVLLGSSIVMILYPDAAGLIMDKERNYDAYGNSYILLNIINVFISPYPNVKIGEQAVNLYTASFAIIHICIVYFALTGIYYAIKEKKYELYPILSVYLMNGAMLAFAGFSMNARYHYPLWGLYYMFIPIGIKYLSKKFYIPYICGVFLITFLYNFR